MTTCPDKTRKRCTHIQMILGRVIASAKIKKTISTLYVKYSPWLMVDKNHVMDNNQVEENDVDTLMLFL